jgi:hypothetical protein
VLHEFLSTNRAAILARTRATVAVRPAPRPTEEELQTGIPLFLDQLIEILRSSPDAPGAMAESATRHGARLLKRGFTVAQVVHDYGGVCQAVTELADETNALITADEFRIFNRCLDEAIAGAVTEYTTQREQSITNEGRERLGELAHELRDAVGGGRERVVRGAAAHGQGRARWQHPRRLVSSCGPAQRASLAVLTSGGGLSGNRAVKVAPSPGWFSTVRLPP